MNILITGITGFIGKNLYLELLDLGYNIFAIIRDKSIINDLEKKNIKCFVETDNINDLIFFIKNNKIDGIIHLASLFLVNHKSEDINNIIESNITFSTRLLESAIKSNVKWFLNTGTFWQNYNNQEYSPINLYASTKEAFINIAQYYTETSDICFLTIKLNDTYGKNDTRAKLISTWVKISETGEKMDMSAGEQLIDIVYIKDIISAYNNLIELLKNNTNYKELKNQIFSVSSLKPIKLREMAEIFEKVSNKKLNINWGARDYREREIMLPWNKFKLVPNWKPKFDLYSGIKDLLDIQGKK